MRELFIEELAEVKGGAGPLEELLERIALSNLIQEHTYTTHACGEEGSSC
ncbi:MAG TPA: hypothetical protein VHN37_01120 [Actinomycetota bacterium]|nr:hypothetical protein [Actinomycetota bacterium]